MTPHSLRSGSLRLRWRLTFFIGLWILNMAGPSATAASEAKLVAFDLPPDLAEVSLKRFSLQSSREVLFAADVTDGIRTNAVKGRMTPAEALRSMLAKTGLIAVADAKTGAFSVRREGREDTKNDGGAVTSRPAAART